MNPNEKTRRTFRIGGHLSSAVVKWALLVAFTFPVCAAEVPAGLRVSLKSCVRGGYLNASGTVSSVDGFWQSVTLRITVRMKRPGEDQQEFSSPVVATDVNEGREKSFDPGFRALEAVPPGTVITACEAKFVSPVRIVHKPALVTNVVTPVAKNEDCFHDLVKAEMLKGLDRQKRFSELLEYGCITAVPSATLVTVVHESKVEGESAVYATFQELGPGGREWAGYTLSRYLGTDNVAVAEEFKN